MTRTETLKLLQSHKARLARDFGVIDLALFGSAARDEAGPGSDIDILVAFDGPATSRRYFGVQFYLEDLLGPAGGSGYRQGPAAGTASLRRKGGRPCLTRVEESGNGASSWTT